MKAALDWWLRLSPRGPKVLSGLILVCLVSFAFLIAINPWYQWDFRVFHAAPWVLDTGANPYDYTNPNLNIPKGFSFLYPPITLYVLRPFSLLPYHAASLAWLAVKLCALLCLFRLWHTHFEKLDLSWWLVLFFALGFNAAILRDLAAGNIAIFEMLGLWYGFSLLIRNKSYAAGTIFAITAQFKLMPIVFVGLLLFVGPLPRWRPFVVSIGVFVGLLAINLAFQPEMSNFYIQSFGGSNPNLDERQSINPSSLAVLRDIVGEAVSAGFPISHSFAGFLFIVLVGVVGLVLLWALRNNYNKPSEKKAHWIIYLACVVYVLTMPRVKDYTFIILLIPGLFVIRKLISGELKPGLIFPSLTVLMVVPQNADYLPLLPWVLSYQPWLLAWCLLYYLLRARIEVFTAPPILVSAVPVETSNS